MMYLSKCTVVIFPPLFIILYLHNLPARTECTGFIHMVSGDDFRVHATAPFISTFAGKAMSYGMSCGMKGHKTPLAKQ